MKSYKYLHITLNFILSSFFVQAQPDFSNAINIEEFRCYGDMSNPNLFYYPPGELSVVTNREGKPDFNFLQMRYTGNIAYGDQGESRFTSIVRFRVKMKRMVQANLDKIKNKIWGKKKKGELRPLPISDMKSSLIFASIKQEKTDTLYAGDCTITSEGKEGNSKKGSYWREREFSLRLDNYSAQALADAFKNNNTLMSFSYTFISKGINGDKNELPASNDTALAKSIEGVLNSSNDSVALTKHVVKSNAFSIAIDTQKWPDVIKQIDVNEQIPPGYAAIEVRCYDFNNELRPDLHSKSVEVKAEGVGRGDVTVIAKFNKNNPDIYVQYIRFPYAVKLDKLPQYRVKSISDDLPPTNSGWIVMDSWTNLIDITSLENEIPVLEEEN